MSDIKFGPETVSETPRGFRWGSAAAGIKYPDRRDVAVVFSMEPCTAAGVFTRNTFAAAPVAVCRELLGKGSAISGVVVNSGSANAATGLEGMENARRMAAAPREELGTPGDFLVCSTGTIGVQLPMERLLPGIREACKSAGPGIEAFDGFSRAILTTDTRPKVASATLSVNGHEVRILACAKGAGMMQPNMATMLAYVTTDACLEPSLLHEIFSRVCDRSLNCVTVDGDTSTNDTAVILASGAGGAVIDADTSDDFEMALLKVMQSLARQLARDGEGASKLIEVEVRGAQDFLSARAAAFKVANSPLVKTAIYGRDANWGRIAMALGNAGLSFSPDHVTIRLGELELFKDGAPVPFDEEAALQVLGREFIRIEAHLGQDTGAATVWTCDLTEKYIEINGSYRT